MNNFAYATTNLTCPIEFFFRTRIVHAYCHLLLWNLRGDWVPILRSCFSYWIMVFIKATFNQSSCIWLFTQTCEVLHWSIDLKEEICSIFQAAQGVMFLAGTVGIKIAIAKILGIADDVSQEKRCFNKCVRTSYVWLWQKGWLLECSQFFSFPVT